MGPFSGGDAALTASRSSLECDVDAGFSNKAQDIFRMQRLYHARIVFLLLYSINPFSTFRLFLFYPSHHCLVCLNNSERLLTPFSLPYFHFVHCSNDALMYLACCTCCFMYALIYFVSLIYISLSCISNNFMHTIRSLFIFPSPFSVCNPAF